MRTFCWLFSILFSCSVVCAASVPGLLNYQGKLLTASGLPLPSGDYDLNFNIFDAQVGGNLKWGPQIFNGQTGIGLNPKVPVVDGHFNIVLGEFDTQNRSLSEVFTEPNLFLEITIGSNPPLDRQQFLTAPFVFQAKNSETLAGHGWSAILVNGNNPETGKIAGAKIQDASITSAQIADGTIADTDIGSLSADMLTSGTVAEARLPQNAIDGTEIEDDSIMTDDVNSISADKIGPGTLDGAYDITGFLTHKSETGVQLTRFGSSPVGVGYIETRGPTGSRNFVVSSHVDNPEHGFLGVLDEDDIPRAALYIDSSGNGIVQGDTKSFVVKHPTRPDTKIVYVSLEGPECGIYHRGKVTLANGQATIHLPEYFVVLANMSTATVHLTPHSLESKGLAVASINETSIDIGELSNGNGAYDVSFLVQAVRKGYEDHQPVMSNQQFNAKFGMATGNISSIPGSSPSKNK